MSWSTDDTIRLSEMDAEGIPDRQISAILGKSEGEIRIHRHRHLKNKRPAPVKVDANGRALTLTRLWLDADILARLSEMNGPSLLSRTVNDLLRSALESREKDIEELRRLIKERPPLPAINDALSVVASLRADLAAIDLKKQAVDLEALQRKSEEQTAMIESTFESLRAEIEAFKAEKPAQV